MPKDYGELNFDKIFEKMEKMADKIIKSGANVEAVAENSGQQIGESFTEGIEQGMEDAANRIAASSFKITKAFKDLAKKVSNQKDIFSISLGGQNVVLDIDFSDIDIDSEDFQKKINEIFEKFKIENSIEFDSKAAEKQFKDMLGLHAKYAAKLSKLQERRPRLTSQTSIKANAQEQLAVIDGLKEIQRVLEQTSGMSLELPHVHFGDVRELRTSISLIEQMEKGEEKVGKQRDTNAEKIRKENKELRERNKILEEKVGPIEEGELPPARKPRARKPKAETPIVTGAGDSALQQLKRDAEAASKAFEKAHNRLSDILEAERKLDEQIKGAGFVDYASKIKSVEEERDTALSSLGKDFSKKADHKGNYDSVLSIVQDLIDKGAIMASNPRDLYNVDKYLLAVADYSKHTKEELNQMLEAVHREITRQTQEAIDTYNAWGRNQENADDKGLITRQRELSKEHDAAAKAYNEAAEAKEAAYKRLQAAEDGDLQYQSDSGKVLEDQNEKLAERNRLIEEYLEAQKKRYAIESKYGSRFKEDITLEDYNEWVSAMDVGRKLTMRYDGGEIIEEANERILSEFKEFGAQFDNLHEELGDPNNWLERYGVLADQVRHGALTAAEAVAKLKTEVSYAPPPRIPDKIPDTDTILADFKELVKPGDIDDIGDIKAENGALEDRLELLKEISDQYGVDGLNKDAKAYYKLWLKEMDDQEFNASQQERYDETSDSLENAAKNLVSFGAAYDKIIVKFGKGKPLEILPNVKGLEDLAKIANEYGEAYNGKEISDVLFVRTKESAVAAARAAEEAFNAELESAVAAEVEEELKAAKQIEEQEEEQVKQAQAVVQLVDNYGKSLDEVNNKLMQGTKLLNEQGQIIRLFHNSPSVFDEFDPEKAGSNQGQALGLGNYLALRQNGEFNDPTYGRYQTQWYADVQNPFNVGDELTSDQAASVIDKFLADRAEGFKNHMLSKLLDGDVVTAIKDIAYESKTTVGEIFAHIGYDAVMDGAQINVFDPSKIHRANDAVLDTGTEEFAAFNELQKKIWEEQRIIENAKAQIKKLSNQYEGQNQSQLEGAMFTETLMKGWGWQENVGKIASAFRDLTGELPKAEGISEDTMRSLADNYDFVKQNLQSYKDAVAEHEKVLDNLSAQFIEREARIHSVTQAYLDGESNLTPEKKRNNKFTRTINGKSGKFSIKKPRPETYETDSGQMSMLPAVEAETDAKNKLAEANEKVAKSQKKVKEAAQGTQLTIDDVVPGYNFTEMTPDEASEWLNGPDEAKGFEKVEKAAEKASKSKKKFAGANKEVKNSIAPSVEGLNAEAEAMEDVEESAEKTTKTISEEAKRAAESMSFSTRDYEKLYDEMEAFAEQRKAENGYDLSKVSVNTDAHGAPLGATISYYKKATKETITEIFTIDKKAQEAAEGVNRLVLSSRKATAGIADFEKAALGAINRQDQLMAQKNKTISSLSGALDPNANRTLFGTDYEDEARKKIKAIEDEVAKLDQVIDGERVILSEKDFLATKRRIAELTQEARDFIVQSKNAEYAPTQLESHSVSSGNQYRADQLKAKINEWERAGIYAGDLKKKAEELSKSVTNITKHEDLKKYLEGMKEARALATLATQDKKVEEERQKALNKEYEEYIALIAKRDAIESKMIGLDPEKNRDELAALQADYDAIDNEFNSKYGDFLSRKDVQEHFTVDELTRADDAARRKMAVKEGKVSDKRRLEEETAAQQKVNEAYREYVRLIQERGRAGVKLAGLDPEKNKAEIEGLTAYIDEIDGKLNETYGELLSNHVAQATLTLEDFMKYYDKWQQKLAEKEAKAADKARNKEEKPYRDYGKTTANSVVRKRDNIQGEIDALGVTNPKILAQMDDYKAKVQSIVDLRAKFEGDPEASKEPELVKQFQKTAAEAERVRRGIKAVIDEERKMMQLSAEQGFDPVELNADQLANLENEMVAHAKATAQGRMEIKGWNDDHTKMYYTVTNSKGVVEEMTMALGQGRNMMYQYRTATKETGTLMQQIFKGIKTKAKELISFVIGGGGVYKVVEMLRQGIQYVREIDIALTELKKVTNETEEAYDKFLETAAKTADKVGSTIKDVVSSTADWARLGYSMKEAAELAESTQILMNVSEFTDVSQATDTLISAVQAFGYTADTSMEVVDLLNTIGNNYAISTADLAQSLTKSSASLVAAGGDLAEAAALTATANAIIQDADSVGTALKTTSLRLRGTDVKVLEEEGLDSEGAVTSKSKLQSKVKALSGVDILTATGEYKSTYEILSDIADVWESMNDMDQAALLELISGKRNSSVIAAILQNPQELKDAYEDAMDAEGSALKENEKYLDSIQGKIDQFNNAMQSMWSDTLDSDMVKGFVELATQLVKIVDAVGPLNIALVGFFTFLEKKHGFLSNFFKPAEDGVEALKKQLVKAEQDLAKATEDDLQHGSKKTAQERRDAQDRVDILRKQIDDAEPKAHVDPELDALIGDRDSLAREVDAIKARREELAKAVESDSSDDMLKLVEIDTTSIDDEIEEAQGKLEKAKKSLVDAQAEPATRKVNGGVRMNKDRDIHIADASQEIADIEKSLDSLQQKKADTIHYAAQFDLADMDNAIGEASTKLDGMTAAINAKTAAQNADNAATVAGVAVDQAAAGAQEVKTAATWKELAAQIMSGEVTKANIGASIKNILVTKLASTALGEKIATHYGVQVAELGTLTTTQLLTGGFSALGAAIWSVLAPLLPFIAIAAAVVVAAVGIVKVIDAVWVTAGETKEKLEELNSEINDLESDLDSLNDELKTTQERMAELLSNSSLSFTEQEELENLKLQNEYLERQIELQELILKNKKDERLSNAKALISKTWDNKSYGAEDYQVDFDDGVIKKDDFWSIGRSGKDAIEEGLKHYSDTQHMMKSFEDAYVANLNKYGSDDSRTESTKELYETYKKQLTKQAGGINMVLGDMSNIISENELRYGQDDEIDRFLDEYYAMTLKWQQAQGAYVKSDAISSMFSSSATKEMQNFGKELQEIANSDLTDEQKNAKILEQLDGIDGTIGDGVNKIDGATDAYNRLHLAMDTVSVTAQDIADYFVLETGRYDSSTIEGIAAQYQKGVDALSKYKGAAADVIAEFKKDDGTMEQITWGSLFDDDGEVISTRIAQVMRGADETARNEFASIAKAVNDGKMEVENAIKSFGLSGTLAGFKLIEQSITELNTDVFKNLGDDISGLIDTFEELGSVLESVSSSMDLVSQAEAEQAYSGSVSLETALKLMQTTDDWNKVLTITEGNISINEDATENLVKDQLNLVVANLKTSLSTVSAQIAQNNMAASSDNLGKTIEESTTESVRQLAANMEYLGSLVSDFLSMNWIGMSDRASAAKAASLESTKVAETPKTEVDLGTQQADLVAQLNMLGIEATIDENGNVTYSGEVDWEKIMGGYSSDDASGGNGTKEEVEGDLFQKEMDYWENRIGANQAKYEQIQNEIDLMESKGQKANAAYYREQISLENQRMHLLQGQKRAAKEYLATLEEGSEEWWSTAEVLNGLESEIDDVTASIVDLQDAIDEINVYKFDEFNTRLDNIASKLGTIRDLIAPNGEEDWFDDEGNWTEAGVAVLGSHIQELETYKQGYQKTVDEMAKYADGYEGNENYYEALGIHSEQEYYDKVESLTDQQYDYAKSISDTEQSVVDMYESSIDAVEEYTETLIDGYNDYIDSVKDALDAERSLYDFKKNVKKQAKDIAEIERRIASLSGSTNKADIAERRKLEAQLYESRESLDDTYYDHAKDSQNEALDAEASAYEETMTKMVDGMRTSLQEATADMDTFLNNVTIAVSMNADTVLEKYRETNVYLDPALTNPWENAKTKVGEYGDKATNLMDVWKKDGYFADFSTTAGTNLSSPWSSGTSAANAFKSSVDTVMDDVVTKIDTNIQKASGKLSNLYKQIEDTEARAASSNVPVNGDNTGGDSGGGSGSRLLKKYYTTATLKIGSTTLTATASDPQKANAERLARIAIMGKYQGHQASKGISEERYENSWQRTYRNQVKYDTQYYAKGTIGTTRDEWAITDEPQFGDELTMYATPEGTLSFMRAGSTVVPAEITKNLVEWGQFTPDSMNLGGGVNVNMINNAVNKPEFNFSFDALVKAERIDENTLPEVKKFVQQEINSLVKQMNYAIKGKGGR